MLETVASLSFGINIIDQSRNFFLRRLKTNSSLLFLALVLPRESKNTCYQYDKRISINLINFNW